MQQTPSLPNPADCEQIEIHGCRDLSSESRDDESRIPVVVDDTCPQFFSVYARYRDHTSLCLTDHPALADAVRIAAALRGAYNLPVVNHCDEQ